MTGKKNILLFYSDQHNADIMGCAGHPDAITPNLDKLASEGVLFRRAYCQNGACLPSRASLLSGQYPRTLGMLANSDADRYTNETFQPLQLILKENGYRTGSFGKRHLPRKLDEGFDRSVSVCPGLDPSDEYYSDWTAKNPDCKKGVKERNRSFHTDLWSIPMHIAEEKSPEGYVANNCIDFIRETKKSDHPFFAWCAFHAPHQPYTPAEKFFNMYDPDKLTLPRNLHQPAEQLPPLLHAWRTDQNQPLNCGTAAEDETIYRNFLRCYYGLVSEFDWNIGRVTKVLEEEGLLEDTIILYTSDHGDFVGAHGMAEKCCLGHNIYEDTLRVPLIVRMPDGQRKNAASDDLVEQVDIVPTLLEAVGVPPPNEYKMPGLSLLPTLLEGAPTERKYAFSENWTQTTVVGERFKLGVWQECDHPNFDFKEFGDMMFDRINDPLETDNLLGKRKTEETELRNALKQFEQKTLSEEKEKLFAGSLRGDNENHERKKLRIIGYDIPETAPASLSTQ